MTALLLCLTIMVHDGDTLRCNGERIRLFGLDCAELHHQGGPEAKAALKNLLRGRIEVKRKGVDRYGRTVGIVFADGRDVARRLIASGACREFCRHSYNKYGTCS